MNNKQHDEFFGRMNDPTATASIKGICGDEMEFYLVIRDDRIEDIRYYTNGCGNSRSSAHAVARRAKGRSINDALSMPQHQRCPVDQCGRVDPQRRMRACGRSPLRDSGGHHPLPCHRRLPAYTLKRLDG